MTSKDKNTRKSNRRERKTSNGLRHAGDSTRSARQYNISPRLGMQRRRRRVASHTPITFLLFDQEHILKHPETKLRRWRWTGPETDAALYTQSGRAGEKNMTKNKTFVCLRCGRVTRETPHISQTTPFMLICPICAEQEKGEQETKNEST